MIDPSMRPMFAGNVPASPPMPNGNMPPPVTPMPPTAPPTAVGTGITSGLEPQVPPDVQQTMDGIGGNIAQDMLNTDAALEQSEDPTELMNLVRGNEKTLEQRYSELAGIVGTSDAQETPESVLLLVQPTLSMMDQAQASTPEGGLGSVPIAGGPSDIAGGDTPVNFPDASFVQSPGTEEASARIQAGEIPVARQAGSPEEGENLLSWQEYMDANPSPYNVPVPQFERFDPSGIQGNVDAFLNIASPHTDKLKPAALEKIYQERRGLLEPYLTPTPTMAQTRAELQDLYGAGLDKELGIATNVALANYGVGVAQNPGTLLQALIQPAGKLATDIGDIASQREAFERDLISTARAETKAAETGLRGQELGIVQAAIDRYDIRHDNFLQVQNQVAQEMLANGIALEKERLKDVNQAIALSFNARENLTNLATETWGKKREDGTWDVIGARRGADGVYHFYDENGETTKVPEGYHPLDATVLSAMTTGQLDWSKAKMANLIIPDPNAFGGYREVAGWGLGGQYWLNTSGDQVQVAPKGFLKGKLSEVFEIMPPDSVGRVKIAFKQGPLAGSTMMAGITVDGKTNRTEQRKIMQQVRADADALLDQGIIDADQWKEMVKVTETRQVSIPDGKGGTRLVEITSPISLDVAYQLIPPKYTTDSQGRKVLIESRMNPLVETQRPTGILYENMDPNSVAFSQGRISTIADALRYGQDVLTVIGDAVGPLNSVKAFTSNNLAMFAPEGFSNDVFKWGKTVRGRQMMRLFARKLIAATALSDRYAVAEQKIIGELAEDPEGFFRNSEMAAVRFQELLRVMQNDLEKHRAGLENRGANVLHKIPTGTINDPFQFTGHGQFDYLQKVRNHPGVNLDGKYMAMSVATALARGVVGQTSSGQKLTAAAMKALNPNDQILVHLGD